MPITVSTVYTKERLIRLQHFTAANKPVFWTIMIICTLLVAGCWVWLASLSLPVDEFNLYLLYILLLDTFVLFLYFVLPYLTVRKNKSLDAVLTYTFEEGQFHIDASSAMVTESLTSQYAAIYRAVRNKADLYLYINRMSAYIIDLSSLSGEQLALLERTLKAALPAKKVRW